MRRKIFVPCRTCGTLFEKNAPSQKDCHDCAGSNYRGAGFEGRGVLAKIDELEREARATARVYSAQEYSQDFLQELVDKCRR